MASGRTQKTRRNETRCERRPRNRRRSPWQIEVTVVTVTATSTAAAAVATVVARADDVVDGVGRVLVACRRRGQAPTLSRATSTLKFAVPVAPSNTLPAWRGGELFYSTRDAPQYSLVPWVPLLSAGTRIYSRFLVGY